MLADCLVDGHLTFAEKSPGEGMPSHEQQMKHQNRQAEVIVICCADDGPENLLLQFGRCVRRHSDLTQHVPGARFSTMDFQWMVTSALTGCLIARDHPSHTSSLCCWR
jgi:hypothetical protein